MRRLYLKITLILNLHLLVSTSKSKTFHLLSNDGRMTSPPFESYIVDYVLFCAHLCFSKQCSTFSFASVNGRCQLYDYTINETEEIVFEANSKIYIIACDDFKSDGLVITGQHALNISFFCEPGYYQVPNTANYAQCTFSARWSQQNPCVFVRTCYEAYELGIPIPKNLSVKFNHSMDAVEVRCVNDGPGVLTVVGHNHENEDIIIYTDSDNYKHDIPLLYNIPLVTLTKIIDESKHCRQYMRLKCKNSELHYFLNRSGKISDYFIGGVKRTGRLDGYPTCGCYEDNSCYGGEVCNCNANDLQWREDAGYITDKEDMPVTQYVGIDTELENEEAMILIGAVECWGKE